MHRWHRKETHQDKILAFRTIAMHFTKSLACRRRLLCVLPLFAIIPRRYTKCVFLVYTLDHHICRFLMLLITLIKITEISPQLDCISCLQAVSLVTTSSYYLLASLLWCMIPIPMAKLPCTAATTTSMTTCCMSNMHHHYIGTLLCLLMPQHLPTPTWHRSTLLLPLKMAGISIYKRYFKYFGPANPRALWSFPPYFVPFPQWSHRWTWWWCLVLLVERNIAHKVQ